MFALIICNYNYIQFNANYTSPQSLTYSLHTKTKKMENPKRFCHRSAVLRMDTCKLNGMTKFNIDFKKLCCK